MGDRKENYLDILRSLEKKPSFTQRKLASKLGFSLGKLSYCLKGLQKKGLVKMKNFSKSKSKIKYIYKFCLLYTSDAAGRLLTCRSRWSRYH